MKTIEEKAKAYDEIIERAKTMLAAGEVMYGKENNASQLITDIIPELCESEDEMMRNWLLVQLETNYKGNYWAEKAVAYLQRQKEPKPRIEICPHSIKSKSYRENGYPIENCDYGLEIAYDILEKTFGEVRGYQTDDGIREHQTAIEAVRKAKEQKPAWSEEDEKNFLSLCEFFTTWSKKHYTAYGRQEAMEKWLFNRFKYLNPQPKAEWSEEEKDNISILLCMIDSMDSISLPSGTLRISGEKRRELKEFINRPSWKPSRAQMSMLLAVINEPNNASSESCHLALAELYEELKKL